MTEQDLQQTRLRDALSDVTRKERRHLLGISLLGVALKKTGLVPSKISGLGIEFQNTDQRALLFIVAFVILYFLVAFIIYAFSDFLAWRLAISRKAIEREVSSYEKIIRGHIHQPGTIEDDIENYEVELCRKFGVYFIFKLVTPTSILRAFFDFGLPIALGGYAFLLLIITAARGGI